MLAARQGEQRTATTRRFAPLLDYRVKFPAALHPPLAGLAVWRQKPKNEEIVMLKPQPSWIRRVAAPLALLVFTVMSSTLSAQPKRTELGGEPVESILWVGNSFFYYNNSLHGHLGQLISAGDAQSRVRGVSVTISGSGIDWHDMESYLRPGGIGKYSFVADNKIVFNKPGRQFDTVIMMDCSQCPIHPQLKATFHEYMKRDSAIIAKAGARPVLFMSWAYKDKPEMTAQLAEQYTLAGNDNDALVIPAGLAFAKAVGKRPELELYQPDKRHPTLAGTYLAACTSYATVFNKSPVGNKYMAGLDAGTAHFLQEVALETVKEYLKR
jgi:hypothetical protein